MDRFYPTSDEIDEFAGVMVCDFMDGSAIAVTDDVQRAVTGINTYRRETGGDWYDAELEAVTASDLLLTWVVFERRSDPACPWAFRFSDADEDMAVRLHYLPA